MAVFHHQPPTSFDIDVATHLPASGTTSPNSHGSGIITHSLQRPILDPTIDPSLFTPSKRACAMYSSLSMSNSASFLVAKAKLTSAQSLPPIILEKAPADNEEPDWEAMRLSLERLHLSDKKVDDVTELSKNIGRAQRHNRIYRSIAEGAQAQLVLASMHNAKLQVALNEKEKGKTDNLCLLDDGMPRIWTSDSSREQVRERTEAREKEEKDAQAQKERAKKKRNINDAIEKEWKQNKAHHDIEIAKWEAQCARWDVEGLPRKYWDPKPTRLTKRQIREQLIATHTDIDDVEEVVVAQFDEDDDN
ncbi:hypothetical protein A7U60_g2203 [Sanghuangporus baumii]|uniref:Uncharacterized protein n=1 Tax=Sanghuangporus baumii TaxID=108892 RepID=A0A9Q5NB43_SANBA|nr:hypothetical protein A7U60_g2203 [Sanghuangporus baumii]